MENYTQFLTWPAITLILGLVFMVMFNKDIGQFLRRVTGIGKGGITASHDQEEKQHSGKSSADDLLNALNSVTMQEQEKSIREDLEKRDIQNPEEREKVLVKYLAVNQLAYAFETVNSTIWASQIALLETANKRTDGITVEEIEPFYKLAESAFPKLKETYPLSHYIEFLTTNKLLTQQDSRYFMTFIGRDFLVYLVHRGHVGNRYM